MRTIYSSACSGSRFNINFIDDGMTSFPPRVITSEFPSSYRRRAAFRGTGTPPERDGALIYSTFFVESSDFRHGPTEWARRRIRDDENTLPNWTIRLHPEPDRDERSRMLPSWIARPARFKFSNHDHFSENISPSLVQSTNTPTKENTPACQRRQSRDLRPPPGQHKIQEPFNIIVYCRRIEG
jgi:hypothetical protein